MFGCHCEPYMNHIYMYYQLWWFNWFDGTTVHSHSSKSLWKKLFGYNMKNPGEMHRICITDSLQHEYKVDVNIFTDLFYESNNWTSENRGYTVNSGTQPLSEGYWPGYILLG